LNKLIKVHDYLPEENEHICRIPYSNKYIYHYSKIDKILKILKNKCLWLTHYSKMNDSSEGKLILEKSLDENNDSGKIYNHLLDNYYMSCFSNYGNLLSQWRSYGDINIGFDRESFAFGSRWLEDKNSKEYYTSGFQFSECQYINANDEGFKKIIEKVRSHLKDFNSPLGVDDQYNLLTIGMICFSSKHSGFKEESESRLFAYLLNKIPIIEDGVEHLKYYFEATQVKRIIIGPSENKDDNTAKIQNFINNNPEYKDIEIYESGIPYVDK